MVHKDKSKLKGTKVLRYIEWGESQGFHKRPTCASRQRWYDLGERKIGQALWIYIINDRYVTFLNIAHVFADCELFDIFCSDRYSLPLMTILNSSLIPLISEVEARLGLGQGALKKQVYEVEKLLVFNPFIIPRPLNKHLSKLLSKLCTFNIDSVFEEIGANSPDEVSLDKVKPARRELDKIIMGEILGLSEEEQSQVYKAVIDLVKSRIEKAKSVEKKKKVKGLDIESLTSSILEEIKDVKSKLRRFPDDYIKNYEYKIVEIPEGVAEEGSDLEGFFVKINEQKIRCSTQEEALYLKYEYGKTIEEIRKSLEELIETTIPERKVKDKVKSEVWRKIFS
jgi:hypothetical protein